MGLVILKLAAAHFLAWGRIQRRDWLPGGSYSFWRALGGAGAYAVIAFVLVALGDHPGGDLSTIMWLIVMTAAIRLVLDAFFGR